MGLLLIYGMGVKKLSITLGIELKEAKELMKKYFKTFPKIKILMDKLTADVEKTRIAVSPLDGRTVDLRMVDWDHGGKKAHAINQAKNLPFQGCGASVSKLAMVWVWEAIRKEKLDAKVICVVHDKQNCCV